MWMLKIQYFVNFIEICVKKIDFIVRIFQRCVKIGLKNVKKIEIFFSFFFKLKKQAKKSNFFEKMGQTLSYDDDFSSSMRLTSTSTLFTDIMENNLVSLNDSESEKFINEKRAQKILANNGIINDNGFFAYWSIKYPFRIQFPTPRVGSFYAEDEKNNILYFGFGQSKDGQYMEDIWSFDKIKSQFKSLRLQKKIPTNKKIGRIGSCSVVYDGKLYIYGGKYETNFLNDILVLDLTNFELNELITNGAIPDGRSTCVLGAYDNKLFVWGGESYHKIGSELHVLDLHTKEWQTLSQNVSPRSYCTYLQDKENIYCLGSSKSTGLVIINCKDQNVIQVQTSGPEPLSSITSPGVVKVENYLIFIGGKSHSDFSLVYALDLPALRWYVLYIKPDEISVSKYVGCITETGLFLMPRFYSMITTYLPNQRSIYCFLGSPLSDPPQIDVLNLSEALCFLHLRNDILSCLHFPTPNSDE